MSGHEGKIYLKPARIGLLVRNPERGGHLPPEGAWVTRNAYWLRRENDNDVVETTAPKANTKKQTVKTTEE